ncbi:MAG: hypothetical protein OXH59_14630 [Rhodospirillaceae bacterium]|nr:hypothetical protein [Rhodospirillaceae bacterium]
MLHDIEIAAPEIVSFDGPPKLFYRYKIDSSGTALVAADAVETIGGEYQYRKWNPRTSEYVKHDEDEEIGMVQVR